MKLTLYRLTYSDPQNQKYVTVIRAASPALAEQEYKITQAGLLGWKLERIETMRKEKK